MKTTTPECAALLQSSSQVMMVELLTLTLHDSTVIRWASCDVPIQFGAQTWNIGPVVERGAVKQSIGLAVDSCDVTLSCDETVTLAGVPLLQAARKGVLDGAWLKIEKGFTDAPQNPIAGLVHLFEGRIGGVRINSSSVAFEVRSFTELLDTMVPLDVYQATCLHGLYSTGCGVSKAANGLNLTVQSGSTNKLIKCAVSGSGTYSLGELVFTSGANAGVRRAVKVHSTGELSLSFPLLDTPSVGDTFTVYKGCDKRKTTCETRFANLPRFKGMPHVPTPETAV